jgi:peptidoglycan/LPS O-acetylase OafA/YrhL
LTPVEKLGSAARRRFLFIDGLRGLAAVSVVVLHLLREPLAAVWPTGGAIASHGGLGVIVFFVISGFVISHTLTRSFMTPATVGGFLLRRVVRLDPPYWASIVLALVVSAASAVVLHNTFQRPSAGSIVAHLFYLQYILGIPTISEVFWTLCYEIQFYLLLALIIAAKQRLADRMSEEAAFAVTMVAPLLLSFVMAVGWVPVPRGSCLEYWYVFVAGVAAQRVVAGGRWWPLLTTAGLAVVVNVMARHPVGGVAAATSLAVAVASARGGLDRWLAGRTFQYLGRISYSLYLTHFVVGARFTNLVNHFVPPGPWIRLGTALAGVALAIGFADLFWRLVERPSIELSRRLGAVKAAGSSRALAVD